MKLRWMVLGFAWIYSFGFAVGDSDAVGIVKVEMDTSDCQRLIPGIFASSARYVEGLDVYGRKVVPASGDGSANVGLPDWLPKEVGFDLQIDVRKYVPKLSNKLGEIGVRLENDAAATSIIDADIVGASSSSNQPQAVGTLSKEEQEKLATFDRDIEALEVYEDELIWTRRAIAGDSLEMAERLVSLQNERKKINARIKDQEKVLLLEKQRVILATGGSAEKNEGMLTLRKRQLQKAETRYYYGEAYLRLQRILIKNSDAQERVKQSMALKDKSEEEGIEDALLVNEQALQKTRASLKHLQLERNKLAVKGGIPTKQWGNGSKGNRKGKLSAPKEALPYGIDIRSIGRAIKVKYDIAQGLLLLNGQALEPAEITNLIGRCKEIRKEKGSL